MLCDLTLTACILSTKMYAALHYPVPVISSGPSYLSFWWTFRVIVQMDTQAMLLRGQSAGLPLHFSHACYQWQGFLLPSQNEASAHGIGHPPDFIVLWVWGQQPRFFLFCFQLQPRAQQTTGCGCGQGQTGVTSVFFTSLLASGPVY